MAKIIEVFSFRMQSYQFYTFKLALLPFLVFGQSFLFAQAPVVNLGDDLVACTQATLDAQNSGSTYSWSTGETSQMITVNSSGEYWVEVTNPNGTSRDTVMVTILEVPASPVPPGTVEVCGSGLNTLTVSGTSDAIAWYDSELATEPFASGFEIEYDLQASTTLYVEGTNIVSNLSEGLKEPNLANGGYFRVGGRGLLFEVKSDLRLDSVKIYTNGALTTIIDILDVEGTIIFTNTFSIPSSGGHFLPIGVDLLKADNYTIRVRSVSGEGNPFIETSQVPFPIEGDLITVKQGFNIAEHHNFFYDFRVTGPGPCVSTRVPYPIVLKEAPSINLGPDSTFCGASNYTLNATNAGANYLWSTQETSASITVSTTGTYEVEVTASNGCVDSASVDLVFFNKPENPLVQDTTICSSSQQRIGIVHDGAVALWYNDTFSNDPFSFEDSISVFVDSSKTLFVESAQFASGFSAGLRENDLESGNFFEVDGRGLRFDVNSPIVLDFVHLYVSELLSGVITIETGNNNILLNRNILDLPPGKARVNLDIPLDPGEDYFISLRIFKGKSFIQTQNVNFPLDDGAVVIKNGVSIPEHYNHFFDWGFTGINNCRSDRVKKEITVSLPINLPDSIYSCTPVTLSGGNPTATYLWNTGASSQAISASVSGEYSVIISDNLGCVGYDTAKVEIPVLELGTDGVFCGNILSTGFTAASNILWNTGDTEPELNTSVPGTYSVEVAEPNGCVLRDTINITSFEALPLVDLGPDLNDCPGIELDAGGDGTTYIWSTGESSRTIIPQSSSIYYVEVRNDAGCSSFDTVSVFLNSLPLPNFSYDADMCRVNFSNLSNFASYIWILGDGTVVQDVNITHEYLASGSYDVSLIASNNCGSDTLTQTIVLDCDVSIEPEVFEGSVNVYPNPFSQEINLEVDTHKYRQIDITITDLLGRERLHMSDRAGSTNWNKQIKLADLPSGIYLLRIEGDQKDSIVKRIIRN